MIHQLWYSRFGWGSILARLSFKEHAAWRPEKLLIEWRRTRSSWVFQKNGGKPPKMDGENNGKPYQNGWFWGETHYFRKHLYVFFKSFLEHRSQWFFEISVDVSSLCLCVLRLLWIYAVWSHFECQQSAVCMGHLLNPFHGWSNRTYSSLLTWNPEAANKYPLKIDDTEPEKGCEMKKRKHSPCHSRFFNPFGSIWVFPKIGGKTPKIWMIYNLWWKSLFKKINGWFRRKKPTIFGKKPIWKSLHVLLVVRLGCMAGGVITLLAFASPSPHRWTGRTRGVAAQSGGVAGWNACHAAGAGRGFLRWRFKESVKETGTGSRVRWCWLFKNSMFFWYHFDWFFMKSFLPEPFVLSRWCFFLLGGGWNGTDM